MPIKVYAQEIADGIGELVSSQASIAYVVKAQPLNIIDEKHKDKIHLAVASNIAKQSDLFYLDTILATTGTNLNKDIFLKEEMWAARHTAEDKPFNLRHNRNDIIGHITSNIVVDEDYKLIPDNSYIEDVPDKFHILTSAVIYKVYKDATRQKLIDEILEEIAEGKWCVSMECVMSNFDYGLINSEGEQRIITRNEESAFLTKHLLQFGGSGSYNGYSIGRVMRNIKFIGKGLVEDPANPDSKILTDISTFTSSSAGLGYIKSSKSQDQPGDSDMNLDELKAALSEAQKEIKELKSQLSEANIKQYTDKISDLEAKLTDATKAAEAQVKSSADKAEEAKAALDKLTKDKEDAEAKAAEYKAEAEKATSQINQLNKDKRTQDRISAATRKNAPEEEAKAFAEKHAEKSDEDFEEVLSYASYKWAAVSKEDKKDSKIDATAAKVLEGASPAAPDVVIAENTVDALAGIQEVVRQSLKKEVK